MSTGSVDAVKLYGQLKKRGFRLSADPNGKIRIGPGHKLRCSDQTRITACKPDLWALVRAAELGVVDPWEMKRIYRGQP